MDNNASAIASFYGQTGGRIYPQNIPSINIYVTPVIMPVPMVPLYGEYTVTLNPRPSNVNDNCRVFVAREYLNRP